MAKRFPFDGLAALLLLAALGLLAGIPSSWAIGLEQAKAQGLVGEQANGYLGVVTSGAASEVTALVADINAKRKQRYQDIANRNNTNLQVVEALAGKTAIEKTAPGQYIKAPSGGWLGISPADKPRLVSRLLLLKTSPAMSNLVERCVSSNGGLGHAPRVQPG